MRLIAQQAVQRAPAVIGAQPQTRPGTSQSVGGALVLDSLVGDQLHQGVRIFLSGTEAAAASSAGSSPVFCSDRVSTVGSVLMHPIHLTPGDAARTC